MMDKQYKPLILSVILLAFSALYLTGMARAEDGGFFEQQKLMSHLLINSFLDKVDRDGLKVFGHELNREDLHSHHVSYVHKTANDTLQVELCFTLAKRIIVPEFDSFYVDSITVEVDRLGNIIEILTHVSPVEERQSQEEDP